MDTDIKNKVMQGMKADLEYSNNTSDPTVLQL